MRHCHIDPDTTPSRFRAYRTGQTGWPAGFPPAMFCQDSHPRDNLDREYAHVKSIFNLNPSHMLVRTSLKFPDGTPHIKMSAGMRLKALPTVLVKRSPLGELRRSKPVSAVAPINRKPATGYQTSMPKKITNL